MPVAPTTRIMMTSLLSVPLPTDQSVREGLASTLPATEPRKKCHLLPEPAWSGGRAGRAGCRHCAPDQARPHRKNIAFSLLRSRAEREDDATFFVVRPCATPHERGYARVGMVR